MSAQKNEVGRSATRQHRDVWWHAMSVDNGLASDVSERIAVDCPAREAADFLDAFITDHRSVDGTLRLTLRSQARRLADRRQPTERPVVATISRLPSSGDPVQTYSITWLSTGDGPSPEFSGALAIEKARAEDGSGLVLSGRYESAEAGRTVSDATRGRRTARVSGRGVLRCIAEFVENARAHKDAAFAGHRRYIAPS